MPLKMAKACLSVEYEDAVTGATDSWATVRRQMASNSSLYGLRVKVREMA